MDADLGCCHQLCGLDHIVLVMVAAQVCVRSASVERSAEVAVLDAIAHVVEVSAYHVGRICYPRNVRLRLDATVRGAR